MRRFKMTANGWFQTAVISRRHQGKQKSRFHVHALGFILILLSLLEAKHRQQ